MIETVTSYKTSDGWVFTDKKEAMEHENGLISKAIRKASTKKLTKFLCKMFNLKQSRGNLYEEMIDAEKELITMFENSLVNLSFIGSDEGIEELSEDILAIFQFFGPERWLQIHDFLSPKKKQSNKGGKK
jgi:hypothetical protein